ncbi:HD-GYP domain-containing protein [Pseudoneobacillus sp. C159]
MRRHRLFGPILAMIFPYLFFESLRSGLFVDPNLPMPFGHFYIVTAVSLLATFFAIAIGFVGYRLRNIKITFLSLAFISLAQLFAIHGLSTPNFILEMSHLPSVAAQLSMVLATIWLWLSSLSTDNKIVVFFLRRIQRLLPIWILMLMVFGVVTMLNPHIVDFIPLTVRPLNYIVMLMTIVLNLITMFRYYQSYRFTRFSLQISIVYSTGWLIVSQIIMINGELWKLSWWLYHFLLLASMIVMLVGLKNQYVEKGTLSAALKAIFTNDLLERITSSVSPSVRKLVMKTEEKDLYTVGHTYRVTMYALKLAEALRLNPEQLRAIAQGTLLHDVGKIRIPDSILNKPGRLSPEERIVIEQHPLYGYEMCRDIGFMKEEMSIIRSHHEKWDGSGYPDRLEREKIPFLARVVAVVDVYDALTSDRSYRKAWTHEEAMKFIEGQKGVHFDPRCVEAWRILCERDPSVYLYPSQTIKEDSSANLLMQLY